MMDIHPEELIDRALTGELTTSERSRLEGHLERCSSCAAQLRLLGDFALEDSHDPENRAGVDRIVASALSSLEGTPTASAERERTAGRAGGLERWMVFAAAAVMAIVAGSGIATALYYASRNEPAHTSNEARKPRLRSTGRHLTAASDDAALEIGLHGPRVPHAEEAVGPPPRSRPASTTREVTPAGLMAAANAARRAGAYRRAHVLYGRLQSRFPTSREAGVVRIAHGRLLLDQLDDPVGALAQFDRYLASSKTGTLAEEARAGRALALGRLGRRDGERRAWEALLDHHPRSAHVPRAQKRLNDLR